MFNLKLYHSGSIIMWLLAVTFPNDSVYFQYVIITIFLWELCTRGFAKRLGTRRQLRKFWRKRGTMLPGYYCIIVLRLGSPTRY